MTERFTLSVCESGLGLSDNVTNELRSLLASSKRQKKLLEDYEELKAVLGNAGASDKAAEAIISNVKKF